MSIKDNQKDTLYADMQHAMLPCVSLALDRSDPSPHRSHRLFKLLIFTHTHREALSMPSFSPTSAIRTMRLRDGEKSPCIRRLCFPILVSSEGVHIQRSSTPIARRSVANHLVSLHLLPKSMPSSGIAQCDSGLRSALDCEVGSRP